MSVVLRRLIGLSLAVVCLGGATGAFASTEGSPYRTVHEAALFLEHGLRTWSHVDLRAARSRSAFCVGAAKEKSGGSAETRFRSFACVLDVAFTRGRTYAFQLHLASRRTGWRVTALR